DARAALEEFPVASSEVAPFGDGLINATFSVDAAEGAFVLQRVHSVFPPEVHVNIAAVTEQLAASGLATPRLVETRAGGLWADRGEAGIWRLMTRLPGVSFAAVASSEQAIAAAGLLARFHRALVGLDHRFVGMRTGVHDTPAHLAALESAIAEHREHRLYDDVARLGEAIVAGARTLPPIDGLPERIVHGDPKLNNVLFAAHDGDGAARAIGLVDLDTVGPMPLPLELGDMWRSWCNRRGEDERVAAFDLAVFEASLVGYAATAAQPEADEREALVHGLEWITLELAARFAADALHERYFGWDPQRFPARGEHDLVRAQGQWTLHGQVLACRARRSALVQAAW
ncbi:MAG TPA: aminoglycoside phosphotransferase family protein, partial [Nannocystaceae bacterium]|nr:aminoglycoside phosphotransferase family protein [Nannocystaceae bacterium]